MPDPVLVARSRVANATRSGGDVESARRALTAAKLERAVREAVAAAPPLSAETRETIARLLTSAGGSE